MNKADKTAIVYQQFFYTKIFQGLGSQGVPRNLTMAVSAYLTSSQPLKHLTLSWPVPSYLAPSHLLTSRHNKESENRFYTPPPRGAGVQKLLSQFWCSRSLKNHFQEVVVYRISLPKEQPQADSEREASSGRFGACGLGEEQTTRHNNLVRSLTERAHVQSCTTCEQWQYLEHRRVAGQSCALRFISYIRGFDHNFTNYNFKSTN